MENIYPLTEREQEILQMVAAGWGNQEIAGILNISPQTVKNHLYTIYYKMGAENRFHAVILGIVYGTINLFVVACHLKPQIPLDLRSQAPKTPSEPIDFGKIRAIWE